METRCRIPRHVRLSAGLKQLALLTALLALPSTGWTLTNALVNTRQTYSDDIRPFTKWTAVMPRYEAQLQQESLACHGDGCINREWESLLKELADAPAAEQLAAINDFFNRLPYATDQENYGIADYWQTPYEMMERGGDCEDYAIAKYLSLRRLGFAEKDMRIIVVKDSDLGGTTHAVLEVTVADVAHILDNQVAEVRAATEVFRYAPMFAINEARWWSYR
jgi:predicted transglutaminase-like cysteine proteinase